eukprot:1178164-Prorocentrum_minimum.AAC.5
MAGGHHVSVSTVRDREGSGGHQRSPSFGVAFVTGAVAEPVSPMFDKKKGVLCLMCQVKYNDDPTHKPTWQCRPLAPEISHTGPHRATTFDEVPTGAISFNKFNQVRHLKKEYAPPTDQSQPLKRNMPHQRTSRSPSKGTCPTDGPVATPRKEYTPPTDQSQPLERNIPYRRTSRSPSPLSARGRPGHIYSVSRCSPQKGSIAGGGGGGLQAVLRGVLQANRSLSDRANFKLRLLVSSPLCLSFVRLGGFYRWRLESTTCKRLLGGSYALRCCFNIATKWLESAKELVLRSEEPAYNAYNAELRQQAKYNRPNGAIAPTVDMILEDMQEAFNFFDKVGKFFEKVGAGVDSLKAGVKCFKKVGAGADSLKAGVKCFKKAG